MAILGQKKKTYDTTGLKVPVSLGVIMDGNGRWAKKRLLPRSAGHRAGAESLDRTMHWCKEAGIKYLTVYAFSTENFHRAKKEVGMLMDLMEKAGVVGAAHGSKPREVLIQDEMSLEQLLSSLRK